jgi:hypothetical protein
MQSEVSYQEGWYTVRMPTSELLLFTNMFIEGLEQLSDGLLEDQLGVGKREAQEFMTDFTTAMSEARARSQSVD